MSTLSSSWQVRSWEICRGRSLNQPSSTTSLLNVFVEKLHASIFWYAPFLPLPFSNPLACGDSSRHLHIISVQELIIICRKLSLVLKQQIQLAFKCTRIYYPIWRIIQASGAVLGTEAVDWFDKYFQIGSAYYFTQSEAKKQIGYRREILFAAS